MAHMKLKMSNLKNRISPVMCFLESKWGLYDRSLSNEANIAIENESLYRPRTQMTSIRSPAPL